MAKALVSLIGLIGLIILGNGPLNIGKKSLPPIGKLMSPFQGFSQQELNRFPAPETLKDLKHIEGTVDLVIDERGVPHIFADNINDAYRVQGYLHAYNRMWQMDIMSRFISGRLSEMLGELTINQDLLMRRRGMTQAIDKAVNGWNQYPKTMTKMAAYVDGVNSFINQIDAKNKQIEYKLLNFEPQQWSIRNSIEIYKSLTYDLCFNHNDPTSTATLGLLGEAEYKSLFPLRRADEAPIIPSKTAWNFEAIPQSNQRESGFEFGLIGNNDQDLMPSPMIGSNNWVVNGNKTASGNTILCNDPHLGLKFPAIWYEIHIHSPEGNVRGVSLPGMPGVIIGFNEDIAWGLTNAGHDVLDWYQLKWANEAKGTYLIDGKAQQLESKSEIIKIKNRADHIETVKYSQWGPLVYQYDSAHMLHNSSMYWLGSQQNPADEGSTFMKLNASKSTAEYLSAVKQFGSPAQNIVFASRSGDIAMRVSGKLPLREKGIGEFIYDGSQSSSAWKGLVPDDQNPFSLNPEQNYLASANQVSTDSTYPYEYIATFDQYRGRILNRKLKELNNISIEDMKDLQLSSESIFAEEGMSLFRQFFEKENLGESQNKWKNKLLDWDLKFNADNVAPALFNDWFMKFNQLTWDEFQANKNRTYKVPEYWKTMEIANQNASNKYFDILNTDEIENAKDIAQIAFSKTVHLFDSLVQKDPDYNWQKSNNVRVRHMMNLDAFSTEALPVNGFRYALNASRTDWGPSWRMIVELGEENKGFGVFPGGPSGNPGSPFYDSNIPSWTKGQYFPLTLYKNAASVIETEGGKTIKSN